MRISRDEWAMRLVEATAKRSTCLRRQVGCILLDEKGLVIATGYNGVASGEIHCNQETEVQRPNYPTEIRYLDACLGSESPSGTNLDGCKAIHAEQNAMLQCSDVRRIHTAYVSASPCMTCTKLLMNTGCKHVVFLESYPHGEARDMWLSDATRTWTLFTR